MTLDDLISELCEIRRRHALIGRSRVVFDATRESDTDYSPERFAEIEGTRTRIETSQSRIIIFPDNPL